MSSPMEALLHQENGHSYHPESLQVITSVKSYILFLWSTLKQLVIHFYHQRLVYASCELR